MPTNEFPIKLLNVKLLAGEQKATENRGLLLQCRVRMRDACQHLVAFLFLVRETVDGQDPAPPWNDDSLVNANKQGFLMVSKWCNISSIHSTKVVESHGSVSP